MRLKRGLLEPENVLVKCTCSDGAKTSRFIFRHSAFKDSEMYSTVQHSVLNFEHTDVPVAEHILAVLFSIL